jgi:hypothetical protein
MRDAPEVQSLDGEVVLYRDYGMDAIEIKLGRGQVEAAAAQVGQPSWRRSETAARNGSPTPN